MLPKLIRDNIVQEILNSGRECVIHRCASTVEYNDWSIKKMREEVAEFCEAPSIEEAADIYEVFLGLLRKNQISLKDVRARAALKRDRYGSFTDGIVLHEVLST